MNRDDSKCTDKTLASVFFFSSTVKDLRLGDKENDSGYRKLCDRLGGE